MRQEIRLTGKGWRKVYARKIVAERITYEGMLVIVEVRWRGGYVEFILSPDDIRYIRDIQ